MMESMSRCSEPGGGGGGGGGCGAGSGVGGRGGRGGAGTSLFGRFAGTLLSSSSVNNGDNNNNDDDDDGVDGDALEPPEHGGGSLDPLGPGERELRWSLLRVRCWDCWEEPGAWLKECDTDVDAELALEQARWLDEVTPMTVVTPDRRQVPSLTDHDDHTDCLKLAAKQPSCCLTADCRGERIGGGVGGGCSSSSSSSSSNNDDCGDSSTELELEPTNRKQCSRTMLLSPLVISSGLLSPPVDGGPLNGVEESAGFYMLKKDSQRRQTIVKVMQEDKDQLLSIWMDRIKQTLPPASVLLIREEHLRQLLTGIIAYVPSQDKAQLSKVLALLKESLDYDGHAVSQLQTALFVFQHSMMAILTLRQNIKPHWMFALDNLVKQCCHSAVSILSPELAANISGHNIEEEEDDRASTTSGVSTSNSVRSAAPHRSSVMTPAAGGGGDISPGQFVPPANLPGTGEFLRVFGQLGAAKEETANLVNTLVQSEKLYQDLLVSLLQSRRHQRKFVQDVASDGQTSRQTSQIQPQTPDDDDDAPGSSAASMPTAVGKEDGDPAMVKWLEDIGLDEESVTKFVKERFTIEDVLQLVDRDDLKRLGLKLGYEVRVWTAIQRHRSRKENSASSGAGSSSSNNNTGDAAQQ